MKGESVITFNTLIIITSIQYEVERVDCLRRVEGELIKLIIVDFHLDISHWCFDEHFETAGRSEASKGRVFGCQDVDLDCSALRDDLEDRETNEVRGQAGGSGEQGCRAG